MKTLFAILAFVLSGTGLCYAQTISRSDILATLKHIQQLSQEQKNELAKAAYDYKQQGIALQRMTENANKWRIEAHENARERDAILIAFALVATFYFGGMLAGVPLREFPTPWNLVGAALSYAVVFFAAYGLGRLIVAGLARLIP